jgi:hypothetical protein
VSAQQYGRKLSIIVGSSGGAALELADLRVIFTARRGDYQTPNSLDARIYNLADSTMQRISKEFTRVVLQAGYPENFGLIFDGTIKQTRIGRENQTDNYIDITAADGDEAYNFATLALSLAAGARPADSVQGFLQAMAKGGVSGGYQPEFSSSGSVRGEVHYGLARDELREFCENNNCTWSIQDGKLTLVPVTSYIPGEIPKISAATGMIGIPEQTPNGIQVRVLLNPAIKIGQRIKLDNTAINKLRFGVDVQSQANNDVLARYVKTNADGIYYVMAADHYGDTRGEVWYSDLTCLAVDATVAPSAASKGAIAPESVAIKKAG